MTARLPRTAGDIFPLTTADRFLFMGLSAFLDLTGLGRYPLPTDGDYETMSRFDLLYWLYKAQYPVERAVKGADLESFFEGQHGHRWTPVAGFRATNQLRLSAVGDLMDHEFLPNSAGVLYDQVADEIFGADLSMGNLECVIHAAADAFAFTSTSAPALGYSRAAFDVVKGSRGCRYSLLATANNHSLDCGEPGVASTLSVLQHEGISQNGMNGSEDDARSATILEKNGIKVGVIAHTFGLNGKKPPDRKRWIVNRTPLLRPCGTIDFSWLQQQLRYCRDRHVDVVVAQLHWGLEHEYYPRPEQVRLAHRLAEMGFDVVCGHHPHVIQPVEYYRTQRDPDRVVPIFYSLGNLVTPFSHPAFRRSGIAHVTLEKGLSKGGVTRTYVTAARLGRIQQEIDEQRKIIRLVSIS